MRKFFVLSALLLSACANQNTTPTTKYFSLYSGDFESNVVTTEVAQVRLMPISVNQQFNSSNFIFRTSKHEYKTDPYNELMTTPSSQVYQYLLGKLSQQPSFHIVSTNNLTTSNYLLQLDIDQLYSDFQDPLSPFATITVIASLYQNNKGNFELTASKKLTEEEDIHSSHSTDIVKGYDKILTKINNDLVEFVAKNTTIDTNLEKLSPHT